MRSVRLLACGVAAIVAACGTSGASPATSPPTSTTAASTTAITSTIPVSSTSSSAPAATDAPTSAAPQQRTVPCQVYTDMDVKADGFPGRLSGLVGSDIRTEADPCRETLVLQLQGTGEPPAYWVRYETPPLLDDPRGEPVSVAGKAFMVITLESWMPNLDGEGYQGPRRITPTNVSHIKEMVMLGNFESVAIWAIGLDQQRTFDVEMLQDPQRLVVHIAA
jgi:hypothetical protein